MLQGKELRHTGLLSVLSVADGLYFREHEQKACTAQLDALCFVGVCQKDACSRGVQLDCCDALQAAIVQQSHVGW
jgi:hypothetical protein